MTNNEIYEKILELVTTGKTIQEAASECGYKDTRPLYKWLSKEQKIILKRAKLSNGKYTVHSVGTSVTNDDIEFLTNLEYKT